MMISYSANLEDVILNRAFCDVDNGFYADIGSHTPLDCSNTAALYNRGWRGVACDPIYNFEQQWAADWRRWRPRDIVVRDMICDQETGEEEFFLCNFRGMSTGATIFLDKHKSISGAKVTDSGTMVPRTTLTRVLNHSLNGDVLHLICIDVEGMEDRVLKGLDFSKYKPWVFVIESVYAADLSPAYQVWEHMLTEQGYDLVYDDRFNRFYLHRDHAKLAERFAYPPNASDAYKTFREWELERRLSEFGSSRPLMCQT